MLTKNKFTLLVKKNVNLTYLVCSMVETGESETVVGGANIIVLDLGFVPKDGPPYFLSPSKFWCLSFAFCVFLLPSHFLI